MSKEMPLVIYVGGDSRGERLAGRAAELGWTVLTASQERQALGMWVMYMPDLVVIDGADNASGAHYVYTHLRSVEASPLLLLSTRQFQPVVHGEGVQTLPSASTESDILITAAGLLQGALAF